MKIYKLILAVLLLGFSYSSFAEEIPQLDDKWNLHNDSLALVYIGRGNENLLEHHYSQALSDFQYAASLLNNEKIHIPELDFLICFGQIIAYDNLGLKDQCQNAMLSLFLIITQNDDETCNDDQSGVVDSNSDQEEYIEGAALMMKLINLAPSPSVREFLFSLIEDISEDVEPSFSIVNPFYLKKDDWMYCSDSTAHISQCKSHWWRKVERFAKRAYKAACKVKQIWDLIKDIEQQIQKHSRN